MVLSISAAVLRLLLRLLRLRLLLWLMLKEPSKNQAGTPNGALAGLMPCKATFSAP